MSPLHTSDCQLLQEACASPHDWLRLEALVSQVDKNRLARILEQLYEQVDQSDFSLNDWVEALLIFDQWLDEKKIDVRPLANMIGYIHCCTLSLADTLTPPNLGRLTDEMLKQYGFDATTESSAEPGN